jgi:hypothetical protein
LFPNNTPWHAWEAPAVQCSRLDLLETLKDGGNPQEEENQKLRRENQRLTEELRKAAIVIDVQKKWACCWVGPCRENDKDVEPEVDDDTATRRRLARTRP